MKVRRMKPYLRMTRSCHSSTILSRMSSSTRLSRFNTLVLRGICSNTGETTDPVHALDLAGENQSVDGPDAYLFFLYILTKHQTVEELRRINRTELAAQLYAILYDARHAEHWREPDVLSESLVLGAEGPPVKGDGGNNRGGLEVKPLTLHTLRQLNHQTFKWVETAAKSVLEKTVYKKTGRTSRGMVVWLHPRVQLQAFADVLCIPQKIEVHILLDFRYLSSWRMVCNLFHFGAVRNGSPTPPLSSCFLLWRGSSSIFSKFAN